MVSATATVRNEASMDQAALSSFPLWPPPFPYVINQGRKIGQTDPAENRDVYDYTQT